MFAGVLQTGCKKSATDTPVDNRQSRGSRPPIIGDVPFWDKNTSKLEHSVSRSGCGSRGLGLSGVGAARHQSTSSLTALSLTALRCSPERRLGREAAPGLSDPLPRTKNVAGPAA
ncbi:hypothetical protein RRG08_032472 [Elysia crispata]|uniref:Uncharacterized protein n=1 Tax=Elysia crispata TaxID=231223 RepID=A0AAE1BC69_9GAST|nr:hypothetical protein RRG08_032472 [Elysia crispata]